jgi:hypothetical protein
VESRLAPDTPVGAGIRSFRERVKGGRVTSFGVSTGPRALVMDDVRVLPWKSFVEGPWLGRILG